MKETRTQYLPDLRLMDIGICTEENEDEDSHCQVRSSSMHFWFDGLVPGSACLSWDLMMTTLDISAGLRWLQKPAIHTTKKQVGEFTAR